MAAVQLFSGLDIGDRDVADAAGRDVIGVNMMPAGQAGQNRDFAAGVAAVHVVAGVLRLGIAKLLGDFEGLIKAHVLALHLGQHKVGGAVDDAAGSG